MKEIVAIIVTYNRKELLQECIDAIFNQSIKCDVLVVDNNSNDGTEEYLNFFKNRIHYYNTKSNLGGAGGFNYGIKKAYELGYDLFWIMDDDCIPNEDALEKLLNADGLLKGEYGFLSSRVLWKDKSISIMNIQKSDLFNKVIDFDKNLQRIKLASFVSILIKADVVKDVGLPIKDFFIWTDDWEYTSRISKKYPCYYVSDSIVIHKSRDNLGASIVNCPINKLNRFNYLYRNDVYFYRKEGFKGLIYELLRLIYHTVKVLFKAEDNKFRRIKTIWLSSIRGLSFKPIIEHVD